MAGLEEAAARWEGRESVDRAKVFMHGGSQAVRLPKAYRFEGGEVAIRKEGDRVILEPLRARVPLPTRPEDHEAFWAHVDALGPCTLEYPPRDGLVFRTDYVDD